MRRILASLACLLVVLPVPAARCQGSGPYVPLPADHWALTAVRRAEGLGLIPAYLPAQRTASRLEVGRALEAAAARAEASQPVLSTLADGWLRRFREEFRDAESTEDLLLGGRVGWAVRAEEGRSAPGSGYSADQGRPPTGAVPLEAREGVEVDGEAALQLVGGVALHAAGSFGAGGGRVERGELTVSGARLQASLGRGSTAYGYAAAGGVTLSGAEALDRVQVQTTTPVRLPGGLGALAVHAQAAFLEGERHPGGPVFLSGAVTLRPHARLTLAGYRAAILGGDSAGARLTARTFVQSLLGLTQHRENGFSNQVASLDLRYRLPTEGVQPATLYMEWGMEDLDVLRALRDSPGGVAGVYLPLLPGVRGAALGVERASFGRACCGNGIWYRHFQHHGGWVGRTAPLGHPLGGHGRETAAYLHAEAADARLRGEGRVFRRFRGRENLYAPERGGRSHGVDLGVRWRVHRRSELWLRGSREEGPAWLEQRAAAGASLLF